MFTEGHYDLANFFIGYFGFILPECTALAHAGPNRYWKRCCHAACECVHVVCCQPCSHCGCSGCRRAGVWAKAVTRGEGSCAGASAGAFTRECPTHARHTVHHSRLSPHVVPAAILVPWQLLHHPRPMIGPPLLAAQRPPAWTPHFLPPSSCAHTQGGGEIESWPCVQGTPVGSWPPTPWPEARCGQ